MLQRVRARNSGLDSSSFSSSGIGSSERRQRRCGDELHNDQLSTVGKTDHFVYDVDRFTEAVCLETYAFVRPEQRVQSEMFVKVGALNSYGLLRYRL